MPNTLAHIGINGFLTKSLIKKSDLAWIFLGTIIPDIPWIIKKVIQFLIPQTVSYDLHLFFIVQASFLFSLILSGAFAAISSESLKSFAILSLGSFLHLLLDALQIKWANGVHLFAPFTWDLFHIGLFWPENITTYLITILGIVYLAINFKELKYAAPSLQINISKSFFSFILFIIYFITPTYFMDEVEKNDSHFIGTLKNYNSRIGKYIEMDRKKVSYNQYTDSYWIQSFDKSLIELNGITDLESSKISIRGYFVSKDLIKVTEFHENWEIFRDGASYAGLLIIFISWIYSMFLRFRNKIPLN